LSVCGGGGTFVDVQLDRHIESCSLVHEYFTGIAGIDPPFVDQFRCNLSTIMELPSSLKFFKPAWLLHLEVAYPKLHIVSPHGCLVWMYALHFCLVWRFHRVCTLEKECICKWQHVKNKEISINTKGENLLKMLFKKEEDINMG
jgi:hypothetical protein